MPDKSVKDVLITKCKECLDNEQLRGRPMPARVIRYIALDQVDESQVNSRTKVDAGDEYRAATECRPLQNLDTTLPRPGDGCASHCCIICDPVGRPWKQ